MKKKTGLILVLAAVFALAGCTTANSLVSADTDMNRYRLVSLQDVLSSSGSAQSLDLDLRLSNALLGNGLSVIGEKEIDALSDNDKYGLLLVKYSAVQTEEEVTVSITFFDYNTLRPVAGTSATVGWGSKGSLNTAVTKALKQLNSIF